MLYAAYGSNINLEQMAYRCPHSEPVGIGVIKDYVLCFDYHADIRPKIGERVPVLLWDVAPEDWDSLDRYEGVPKYYVKKTVTVYFNGEEVDAIIYVMVNSHYYRFPSEDYYLIIAEGYNQNGMNTECLRKAILYTAVKLEKFNYYKEG